MSSQETAVASFASKATCFLRMLFTFHKIPVTAATPMLGDCKASYDLITQDGASARTRYFERATLLIKRAVLMLILLPFHISTNFMVADLMTKVTDKGTFIRLRNHMMNVHSELRTSLADTMFKIHGEASLLVERLMRKLLALTCVDSRQGGSLVARLRAQAPLACPYHTHMTDPSPMDETDLPPYRWQV